MSRYNHFAPVKYEPINFNTLKVDQKFRMGIWKKKRHSYVIMIKTGDLTYTETKNKKEHQLFSNDLIVYKYEQ